MTAVPLDGLAAAADIKADLALRVQALASAGRPPGLGTLLVGDDPASHAYVSGKHRDCAQVGVGSIRIDLPANASAADVRAAIADLNSADEVTGYIVQLPLPVGLDQRQMLELIDPDKDADGLHPMNLGRLVSNVDGRIESPLPCTPAGILQLLVRNNVPTTGRHVVVLGRGLTVGRPLGLLMTRKGVDATVTLAHSRTADIAAEVSRADIVVAAIGVPHFVRPEWVKPGAAVLDVGVSRVEAADGSSHLMGDVHPDVAEVAGWLSPNPGGVGPMTRAMLVSNVVELAERSAMK